MNVFDLIVLVVLALFTLRGIMKGMVSQIVSVGSYLVCWIAASRFAFVIAPSIPAEEPWNNIGAMVVLFVMTMIAIRFVHGAVEKWIKAWHLAKFNKLCGGALGFAKGILICMVLTFFGVMLSEATRSIIFQSKSGLRFSQLIEKTGAFVPGDTCKILKDQLNQYQTKVSGTPIDPSLEAEPIARMIRESLASLKQSAEEQGQMPGQSSGSGNDISAAFSELFVRGNSLLQQVQMLADPQAAQKQAGSSLLDGIKRWFSGDSKGEPAAQNAFPQDKQALQVEAEALIQEAQAYLQKTFKPNMTAQASAVDSPVAFGSALSTNKADLWNEPVQSNFVQNNTVQNNIDQNVPTIRPALQEEAMIRRGTLASEQIPTDPPAAVTNPPRKELASLLPQSPQTQAAAGLPSFLSNIEQESRQYSSQNDQPGYVTEDAMQVPRRATRFMLRGIAEDQSRSSTHLLNSTAETNRTSAAAPATIFSPSRLERQSTPNSSSAW